MILSNGNPTAVVPLGTLADANPIIADASYYARNSLQLQGMWASYGALYRSQLWVGVVVRKLANGHARLPFDVSRRVSEVSQKREDGPLADLLRRPAPGLSGHKLWLWTSSTFDIYGEAFWLKVRDQTGRVRELRPIHPSNMIARRRSEDDGRMKWLYAIGSATAPQLIIDEDDVVVFSTYSPDDFVRGVSNLEGLRMTLLGEDAARRANASFWRRGARPSVVLQHPGELSEPAKARISAGFNAAHAGADNMGGTAVLEEGMTAQTVQLNAEEMQYIESRKLSREEVCAAYDVPPPAVHILDHATFSNITEQLRSLYRDTMAPRHELFESVVDNDLVPEFYRDGEGVFTHFNMDEVLRGDFETRATAGNQLVSSGIAKPSEIRPMFGFPEAGPEADVLYGNAALVPLGSSVHGQQEVTPAGDIVPSVAPMGAPHAPAPAKSVTVRAIGSRVGRKATIQDKRAALVDEHKAALSGYFAKQANGGGSDEELASLLGDLGTATAIAIGSAVAKKLGGDFDAELAAAWIEDNSIRSARAINETTVEQLKAYLDDPEADAAEFWSGPMQSRSDSIAASRVAVMAGFAMHEAGQQNHAKSKTWIAGSNPRPEHARMDGETVPMSANFSNGLAWPGDAAGGADEVAGCNCSVEFDI